jgi:Cof subfamily protein (haloacid dehalogenase superfamily)
MATPLPEGVVPGGRFADWAPRRARYVVCDVDGTLVGPAAHAADEVTAALTRAQAGGLRVGLATGRMRGAVQPLLEQLRARGPHVLHNGAEVRADGRTIAAWTLDEEQVDRLLAMAGARDDVYVEIYTEDAYHVSSLDERARPHWELLGRPPASVLRHAADLAGAAVLKATFAVFDPRALDPLVAEIRRGGMAAGPAGSPRTPGLMYCNATHPAADKGAALRRAYEHLDLDASEVVAVGDAANDEPMLAVAGTAIAMGQADPAVIEAAHLVVPDVDHHGVAVALDLARSHRPGAPVAR